MRFRSSALPVIADLVDCNWDAIVIGTGMGGATAGYALAKAGKRVLFCEAGLATDDASVAGDYAERRVDAPSDLHETFRRAGRTVETIHDLSYRSPRFFTPFTGSGAGGSSALYGMALERFSPLDFEPRRQHPDAVGCSLPDSWPITYQEIIPYYTAAERLYRVRSGAEAPPLSPSGAELTSFLSQKGLNPYRLPLACEFVPGCVGCQGYRCARRCKNDSARMCLEPAVRLHGATLLDDCRVLRLVAGRDRIERVICRHGGQVFELHADLFILAAGALDTPTLLRGSADATRPEGLANRSGQVGRNLMRHCIDLYAVSVRATPAADDCLKELAFNDFYAGEHGKFGSVQSFGPMPPPEVLADEMQDEIRDSHGGVGAAAIRLSKPLLRPMLRRLFSRTVVLAAVMEDLPYEKNHVDVRRTASGDAGRSMYYRLDSRERARVTRFRALLRGALSPYRFTLLKQAENNRRLAHACGTCRFGDDPDTSVVDANNRAHDLENLYIVDASFFPSSGGTNPSLTIAANALRVADRILGTSAAIATSDAEVVA